MKTHSRSRVLLHKAPVPSTVWIQHLVVREGLSWTDFRYVRTKNKNVVATVVVIRIIVPTSSESYCKILFLGCSGVLRCRV